MVQGGPTWNHTVVVGQPCLPIWTFFGKVYHSASINALQTNRLQTTHRTHGSTLTTASQPKIRETLDINSYRWKSI